MAGFRIHAVVFCSLVAASASMFASTTTAEAGQPIEVVMNEAKIIKLNKDASTIVLGNPLIADATIQDAKTIVLTAKGFGTTNLVILDASGAPIVDERISVKRGDFATMRVYRRDNVSTMSCTPYCESALKSEAEETSEAATNQ